MEKFLIGCLAGVLLAIVAGCEVVPCPPCGVGEVCNSGTGQCECSAGLGRCGGRCFSFQSDVANCGACGKVCPIGEDCHNGQCEDGARPLPDLIGARPVDMAGEPRPDLISQTPSDLAEADRTPLPDLVVLPDLVHSSTPPDLWKCTPSDPSGCGGNCSERCARGKICAVANDCAEAFCDRAICGAIKLTAAAAALDCFPVDKAGNKKGPARTIRANTTEPFPDLGADFVTQCVRSQGGGVVLADIAACDGPVAGPHAPFQTGFGNGCQR